MAKLGEVCKVSASSKMIDKSKAWLLNLDMVEQQTGQIIKYNFVGEDGLNGSITQFDTENVLYSKLRPNLNKVVLPERDGFCTSELLPLRPDARKLDRSYLAVFLRSDGFVNWAVSKTAGAKMPRLGTKDLLNANIPLPEIKEQKAIAENFKKSEELISLRKQQLTKLDELVKARFVEMFGEPSSNPMGWLQTTVGAECYYIKDGPHKSLTDVGMENGYPFISVRNIVNGYIDFSTAKYISEADYKDAIKKCCPEKGDILYSKGGTTGIAKLVDIDIKFANWVHLAVLKFNHNEFNGSFFEKMLNCDYCYKQSQMLTKGIANRDLVLSAMAQIKIYKPPILLQNQFAAFVERIDQQKQTVQQSLEKLEVMKKALMQEYFG